MENENKVITDNTNPEGEGVTPAEGVKADENSQPAKSVKDVLNEALGKEFKTDEEALKSVKDTQDYVGTRKEDQAKKVEEAVAQTNPDSDLAKQVESLKDDNWFAKNNQFEGYKDTMLAIRKPGQSLNEVAESDAFKGIYEKAKGFDENENTKSVLHSNPKLGTVKNKISEANEALARGDHKAANKSAVESVIDTYDLASK